MKMKTLSRRRARLPPPRLLFALRRSPQASRRASPPWWRTLSFGRMMTLKALPLGEDWGYYLSKRMVRAKRMETPFSLRNQAGREITFPADAYLILNPDGTYDAASEAVFEVEYEKVD